VMKEKSRRVGVSGGIAAMGGGVEYSFTNAPGDLFRPCWGGVYRVR